MQGKPRQRKYATNRPQIYRELRKRNERRARVAELLEARRVQERRGRRARQQSRAHP
jgi:hypothetical protein